MRCAIFCGLLAASVLAVACPAGEVDGDAWRNALFPNTTTWKSVAQEMVFANEAEPQTLDPALMTGVLESRLAMAMFEGLAMRDPKTLQPRPAAATSWESSADGLRWTFRLRPEAKWSDGVAVTAEHFISSWKRVLSATTASEYAYMLFPIAGAEAYNQGTAPWAAVGVSASGPHVLSVRLAKRTPWFLDLCTFHTLYPVRVELADDKGAWAKRAPVSNGPFVLSEHVERQHSVFTPNPHYWDRARLRLTKLTARPIDDPDTAWKLYQAGELHWMPYAPLASIAKVMEHEDFYVAPYYGTYYFRFNVTRPPFDDVRVRRALTMATDRAAITRQVTRTGEVPAGWFVPRMGKGATGPALAYNVDAARSELAAAGYAVPGAKGGKPLPPIPLMYNTNDNHKAIAEALAEQWKTALGVTVELDNCEWKVYLDRMTKLDYGMARSAWTGDYLDANTFLDMFVTNGGNNRTGFADPDYDRRVQLSQVEADPVKRAHLLESLERTITVDAVPVLPLYTYVNKGLMRPSVRGMSTNLLGHHPWQCVWLDK